MTGVLEKKGNQENQEEGRKRRMLAWNAERIRGDQLKFVRTGDLDSEGQMSRMRREPNTLFVRCETACHTN